MNYTLITGASGGLGKAFVYQCAERGDNLILTGSNQAKLDVIFDAVKKDFQNISVIKKTCDLSDENDRRTFFEYLTENGLNVNFLINNAGYIAEGDFLHHSDEEILKIIKVNCEGTVDFTQKVIKNRDKNIPLHIITVSSMAGDYPMPFMALYSATKSMLTNLMVALNYELKGQNVFITTVCPSGIPTTDAMKDAIKAQGFGGKATALSPEKVAKCALNASKKHKTLVIPKAINKFIGAFARPLNKVCLSKIVGKRWKKSMQKRNLYNEEKKNEK